MSSVLRPLLAIVTGRPGSGKTTLAAALVAELRCPLVSRDRLKEGALRTMGLGKADDPELAHRICELFFAEIELLLRGGVGLVAEAAFQHKVWAPQLEPLMGIADIRLIVCEVPVEVAIQRRREREREDPLWAQYHPAPVGWNELPEPYGPPRLNVPTLVVDTSLQDCVSLERPLRFLE